MNRSVILLFSFATTIRLLYFFTVPLGQAPDEYRHFSRLYYHTLALRFPDKIQGHTSDPMFLYPPLYYWLGAPLLAPFVSDPPLHTPQAFDQYGTLVRTSSLLISLITILWIALIVHRLFPPIALTASAILFFLPQWTASSFWISMDSLFYLLTTGAVVMCFTYLTSPFKIKYAISFGLVSAAAILLKPFGPMIPIALITAILFSPKFPTSLTSPTSLRSPKTMLISCVLLFTILGAAIWALQNYAVSRTINVLGVSIDFEGSLFTRPFTFPHYWLGLLWWTAETFIGAFGPTNNIRFIPPVYAALYLFIIFTFINAKWKKISALLFSTPAQKIFIITSSTMLFVAVLEFLLINTKISFQPQGRYLTPLIYLLPILIAATTKTIFSDRLYKLLPWIITIILIALNLFGLHCIEGLPDTTGCVYHRVNLPAWPDLTIYR